MKIKDIKKQLKAEKYNERSIREYFKYCKLYKRIPSIEGFKEYGFNIRYTAF